MKLLLLVFSFFFSLLVFSQDILLNNASLPEAEFHVAINPLDSNNIVIAVQHGFGNPSGFYLTIYYTIDFGNTWNSSNYNGVYSGDSFSGDPVLSFDHHGNVMLVNLTADTINVNTILSKSNDGGASWQHVSTIATINTDKPWLAIDRFNTSMYSGNIYIPLVENNLKLYTLDSNYQTIDSQAIPNGDQLPSVVVKSDGTVFTSAVKFGINNSIFVQQYSNGGANLVHSTMVVSFPDYTFNAPDISMRFQPTAYLAIDNSGGSYDGRLYLSYTASETVNPNYFDVFLTYSDDDGLSWSTPKVVHSNQQNEIQQFYSSLYVNDNGVLILDWYDRINYSNTNKQTDFFIGISYDGGNSFTEAQLNSSSSDFDYVIPSSDNFGIGEYHQLVATDHMAISFWSDGRTNDGDLNIYFAKVHLDAPAPESIIEQGVISDKISVSLLYPVPAKNVIHANIKLSEDLKIKYEIVNAGGQKVTDSKWINFQNGEHPLSININLQNGVYFLKIISEKGYFKIIKFIIEH